MEDFHRAAAETYYGVQCERCINNSPMHMVRAPFELLSVQDVHIICTHPWHMHFAFPLKHPRGAPSLCTTSSSTHIIEQRACRLCLPIPTHPYQLHPCCRSRQCKLFDTYLNIITSTCNVLDKKKIITTECRLYCNPNITNKVMIRAKAYRILFYCLGFDSPLDLF